MSTNPNKWQQANQSMNERSSSSLNQSKQPEDYQQRITKVQQDSLEGT